MWFAVAWSRARMRTALELRHTSSPYANLIGEGVHSTASVKMAALLARVRERVQLYISAPIPDRDSLNICLSCCLIEADALLELSFDRLVCTQAIANCEKLALTPQEFDALFCDTTVSAPKRAALEAALGKHAFSSQHVVDSLPLTFSEAVQKKRWDSSRVKAYATLAMLRRTGHLSCLETALGGVLRSDNRRIDDHRAKIEEDGLDLLGTSELVGIICDSLTA